MGRPNLIRVGNQTFEGGLPLHGEDSTTAGDARRVCSRIPKHQKGSDDENVFTTSCVISRLAVAAASDDKHHSFNKSDNGDVPLKSGLLRDWRNLSAAPAETLELLK